MDFRSWASAVAQRSTQLARDGMHFVEKKIEQQQQQLQQQTYWGAGFFRKSPTGASQPDGGVPNVATYYLQPSDCRGFPPADAGDFLQQQKEPQQLLSNQLRSRNMETDACPNCFLLPAGILAEEITVGLFKSLLEPSGSPSVAFPGPPIGAPYHLRFRASCPASPSGFVWIDEPPEDQPVPTCNSSRGACVVCKALLLPAGVLRKEAAATQAAASAVAASEDGGRMQRATANTQLPQTQQQEQHFVACDHNVNSGSEGPPDVLGAAAAGDQVGGSWGPSSDWIVNDIFTEESGGASAEPLGGVHSHLAKSRSAPGGCLQEDDLYHYGAPSGPSVGGKPRSAKGNPTQKRVPLVICCDKFRVLFLELAV